MDPDAARAHLRAVRLLAQLPDETIDRLADAVKWSKADREQPIVTFLDESDSVFFIAAGACRVKLNALRNKTVMLRRLGPGSHFGEIAALTVPRRTVSVVAEAGCLLAECPREAFENLMAADAGFARAVAVSLADTVVSLTERVFELAALQVAHRLYAELLRLAKAGEAAREGILISDWPTHEMVAATIGSTREAVTRELGNLMEQNVIRQDGRTLLIRDIERLRELVRNGAGFTFDDA
jgi:CRP-like cAMP-binding protein